MRARPFAHVIALAAISAACNTGKAALDWGGKEEDARLIADVFTWHCEQMEVDDKGKPTGKYIPWQGVFAETISLEFAPDALQNIDLPSPGGCSAGLDMIPDSAGTGGASIPDLEGDVEWESDAVADNQGKLDDMGDGFYRDDVFNNYHGCQDVEDVLMGGTRISQGGILEGLSTPEPVDAPDVTYNGATAGGSGGFDWGEEIEVAWESSDWEEVWVQIRREREAEAWETVTCNATGSESFTIDSAVWSLMDEDLVIETNNVYVGFQNAYDQTLDDGLKAVGWSRAIAVAVIAD